MSAYIHVAGYVGQAGEVKTLPTGTELGDFTLAVSHWKGAGKDKTTTWCRVKVFGKMAERVHDIAKGNYVEVHGDFEAEEWTGKDGTKKVTQTINARGLNNVSAFIKGESGGSAPASRPAPQKAGEDDLPF